MHYFSHDIFSRENLKIKRLLSKFGMEGYGIFWALCEFLHNNGNKLKVEELDLIAGDLKVDFEKVKSIIFDFKLFTLSKNVISSKRVEENLKKQKEKSKKAKESALKRWKAFSDDANALPEQSESNAIKGKEKKGKENKEKEKKEEENKSEKFVDKVECCINELSVPVFSTSATSQTFYKLGIFENVCVTEKHLKLLSSAASSDEQLSVVVDELSEKIASQKEKMFDEKYPDMHYVRLLRYLKQKNKIQSSPERNNFIKKEGDKTLEYIKKLYEEEGDPPPREFFEAKKDLSKKLLKTT